MSDELKAPELTNEMVFKYLTENEDGKKWLQSRLDAYATKGVQTFETNFMKDKFPKLLDEEISKRYPAETPEQKKLKELELKFSDSERDKQIATLKTKLYKTANEKKIPDFFVDFSLADTEDASTERLIILGTKFNETINAHVEERLKGTGRQSPPTNTGDTTSVTLETMKDIRNMDDIKKNKGAIEDLLKQALKNG